jgi:hypothetical protein
VILRSSVGMSWGALERALIAVERFENYVFLHFDLYDCVAIVGFYGKSPKTVLDPKVEDLGTSPFAVPSHSDHIYHLFPFTAVADLQKVFISPSIPNPSSFSHPINKPTPPDSIKTSKIK